MKKVLIDNVPVNLNDTKVTFGLKSIGRPTPKIAKDIFRWVLWVVGISNIVLEVFPEIPTPIKGMIAMYSMKAVLLVHFLSKGAGIKELPESEK